jgi:hypothetical protein
MTNSPAFSRVFLVAEPRRPSAPGVRRYRLARLRLNEPRGVGAERFAHLKRTYD